jgi:hypothetical protein
LGLKEIKEADMQVSAKLLSKAGWAGLFVAISAVSIFETGTSALAQQASGDTGCKAPQQQQQSTTDNKQGTAHSAADSGKLADCGGVLQPPTTGDSGMVSPAPSVGNTPVIPPSAVPNGQNDTQPQSK